MISWDGDKDISMSQTSYQRGKQKSQENVVQESLVVCIEKQGF